MTEPDPRRGLPRTDVVLADPRLVAAAQRLGRARVHRAVGDVLADLRATASRDESDADAGAVADAALRALPPGATAMRAVINASGVVVHTNLGRAPLSAAAVDALASAAGYVDVEYDLGTGARAARGRAAIASLHRAVPDAPAVHVVNNGAAALLLAIAVLAADRDVVISRGELIEIGEGFRLPELVEAAGGRVCEVGTTNRTHLDDYAAALGAQTGCVLKVHPSNYRIEGFTRSVELADLRRLDVPLVADIGSGLLAPEPALPAEPDVRSALRAGADVVVCSGDKLLGGPQAGLIFGSDEVVTRMRRHPLARAVRVDKLTLAALEATLDGPGTPTHAALHADVESLRQRCRTLADALTGVIDCDVVPSDGVAGGGGAPGVPLPGWAVSLPEPLAAALRTGDPPVITRVARGRCLVDLRCVPADDDHLVRAAVQTAARTVDAAVD